MKFYPKIQFLEGNTEYIKLGSGPFRLTTISITNSSGIQMASPKWLLQEYKWLPLYSHQSQRFSILGFHSQEHTSLH
jgi:hypothetical protein